MKGNGLRIPKVKVYKIGVFPFEMLLHPEDTFFSTVPQDSKDISILRQKIQNLIEFADPKYNNFQKEDFLKED